MTIPTFDDYLGSLSAVSEHAVGPDAGDLELCHRTAATLGALDPLDRQNLGQAVSEDPQLLPVLAAVAGLSQERFKTWLTGKFSTAGWVKLGRAHGPEVIDAMDEEFGLLGLIHVQIRRQWTWADVLAQVMSPRRRAGSAIRQGRDLEDQVEEVIARAGLPFVPRSRFVGTNGRSAPADFAVPGDGADALIVVAVKGFDSTGSKLTDTSREIEEMAEIRKPRQFVFAVIDGHAWARRKGDLRRIHELWTMDRIEGLFNQKSLGEFESSLRAAAQRLGLS